MAFVPEDGTGLPDANSFVDVAYADDYFTSIGNVAWTGEDTAKQAWLIQATSYIVTAFGSRLGCYTKLNEEQALPFPTEENGMPPALLTATCEYAVRAKAGPLMPDPVLDATGFAVVTTRKKVGPIEKEFSVAGGSSQPQLYRSYPYPDSMMRSILCPGTGGNRVIR
jgi:hypothetical protein